MSYVLFVGSGSRDRSDALARVEDELDARLRRNSHHDYCRRLGQLGPCRVLQVDEGANAQSRYLAERTRLGRRLGDVKSVAVDAFDGWAELLPARFIRPRPVSPVDEHAVQGAEQAGRAPRDVW